MKRRAILQGAAALSATLPLVSMTENAMAQTKDSPPFDVPGLRFDWDALEPAISRAALRAHHEEVHKGYADAINRIVAGRDAHADQSIEEVLQNPDAIDPAVRDAALDVGGAHANHQFFWKVIGPGGGDRPDGPLANAIERDQGGFEAFQASFVQQALALDGPGFAFLSLAAPKSDALEIVVLPRNGNVLTVGKPGILVCDLWDHAWAADHASRADWLAAFWTIVDWDVCENRYVALREGRVPE